MLTQDKQKLFFDANIFVAYSNKQDSCFLKAKKILEWADENKAKIFSLDLVIYEVLTVVSLRCGKKNSLTFGKSIFKKREVAIIEKSKKLEKSAWQIFQKVKSKNFSFVDAFILASLKQNPWLTLVSFDKRLVKEAKKLRLKIYP